MKVVTPAVGYLLRMQRMQVAHLIYHELRRRNFTAEKLGTTLGCTCSNVSSTINGRNNSFLVLDGLRELGVPEKYLFDPRRVAPGKHVDKQEKEAV